MSKITRWRRGLWAAGQWWSNAWVWMMGFGGAKRFPFQTTQTVVLIFLLLLALTSAVIRPPYEHPKKLSTTTSFQQRKHLLRMDRRSLASSSRYRPSTFSHTTHCFFNQLCSCKVLLRRSGHGESTSVDDFGNIDYYDGFPVRDLMNGDSSIYSSSSSQEETTEVYQGQFGSVTSVHPDDNAASSTENTNKFNATSHARSSEYLPKPSRLKGTGRGSKRGRGRMRGSFFERMGKHVQDISCVGVPFTSVPGTVF